MDDVGGRTGQYNLPSSHLRGRDDGRRIAAAARWNCRLRRRRVPARLPAPEVNISCLYFAATCRNGLSEPVDRGLSAVSWTDCTLLLLILMLADMFENVRQLVETKNTRSNVANSQLLPSSSIVMCQHSAASTTRFAARQENSGTALYSLSTPSTKSRLWNWV